MRNTRLAGLIAVGTALAIPAAGIAAKAITPKNGQLKGSATYPFQGATASGQVTITVAKHKISGVDFKSVYPPVDPADSSAGCGSANDYSTSGFKRTGTISVSGHFNYTFTDKANSSKITLVGQFSDASHATGKWRDVYSIKALNEHCDTGTLKFSVAHS